MKTLNLDSLGAKEQRELVMGGKTHVVKPMSVKAFIATTKVIESLKEDQSVAAQINGTVSIIRNSVPTLDEEELFALPLEHLRTLMEFVRGDDAETVAEHDSVIEGEQPEGEQTEGK